MSEQHLDPEVTALADALARLQPRPAALDRDALMFRAGQAAAPRGWKWPTATVAAMLLAVGFGVVLLARPQPAPVERIVYVKVPAPATTVETTPEPKPPAPAAAVEWASHETEEPLPQSKYQRLQDHLLRWGFDGLPPAPYAPLPKETPQSLLESL